MSAQLVFIRHCRALNRSEGEAECMSGWTDFPLSGEGRAQAALLAKRLHTQGVVFAALYSSPLRRAADTARAIADRCPAPVQFSDSLKEIGCGDVDGLPIARVKALHSDLWQQNQAQVDDEFRWPGGESYLELRRRCIEAVERIAQQHDDQRVAIVTHAGVISQVIGFMHGARAAQWEPFRPGYGSLTEIAWQRGTGQLISFDDRAHLDADEGASHASG